MVDRADTPLEATNAPSTPNPDTRSKDYYPDAPDMGIDMDAPYHDWAITGDNTEHDRFALMPKLEWVIAELPQTAATFRPTQYLPFDAVESRLPNAMMEYLGAWQVPKPFESQSNAREYINPRYAHVESYPKAFAYCQCGTAIFHSQDQPKASRIQGDHDHADDCTIDQRLRARANLAAARREVIVDSLHLNLQASHILSKLGMKRNRSLAQHARRLGIDYQEEQAEARRRFARTWVRLLPRYTPAEIGRFFGVPASRVRSYIKQHTDTTTKPFQYHRQRNHE